MRIGKIETKNNFFLAPMAGVTDGPFRTLCREFGAGLTYSEMVSAKGLYYKDKKTKELLKGADGETPYAVQIFGSEPDIVSQVAREAASYGDILDFNMGCPTPKIVKNGDGSALMKNLTLMGEIMYAAADNAGVPVTAKIRMGWDSNSINAVEAAKVLEKNGAAAITVHGRTREAFYSGRADWNIIKEVKAAVSIPVIGNGDISSYADYIKITEMTGCDAIMLGRAVRGNPFIFRNLVKGNDTPPTPDEILEIASRHVKLLCEEKGEYAGIRESRKHIAWYIKGMPGSTKLKGEVFKCDSLDKMLSLLNSFVK